MATAEPGNGDDETAGPEWEGGIPIASWGDWVWDGEYRAALAERVRREREAAGLPDRSVVRVTPPE